jgi:hypothetical protein
MKNELLPDTLNPRQRKFVLAFIDPEEPSYQNRNAAMRVVSPNATPGSLRVMAYELMHDPLVAKTIAEAFKRADFGIERRAGKLAALTNNPELGKSLSRVTKTKNVTEIATQKGPTWAEMLKAVEIANNAEGIYEAHKRRAAEDAAAEAQYRDLRTRFFPCAAR